MTLAMLFAVAAIAHAAMLAWSRRFAGSAVVWLMRLLLAGLMLDNTILAISPLAFEENWYADLSRLRYFAHVLVLPPLIIVARLLAVRAGVHRAASSAAVLVTGVLAAAAITYGVVTELADLQLVPESLFGHNRYVSAHAGLPLATIFTNVVLLVFAFAIGRTSGWWIAFAGTAIIFLVNGALGGSDWGIVGGNIAEIFFAASWVLALRRFAPD